MSLSKSATSNGKKLRLLLRILGCTILLCGIGFWLKTGAHNGFSKNRVEIEKVDPITKIEYIEYEERFVMGLEYLAVASAAGVGLWGLSFFFGRNKSPSFTE